MNQKKKATVENRKGLSIQQAAYHIGFKGSSLQKHFDIAVVIPTTLRDSLERALDSIFKQDLDGRIQILIGIDKSRENRKKLKEMCTAQPANCVTTILDLGYSTSVKHGGIKMARDGGGLRTALSYLANSRYIAYLDDDNWWAVSHL